MPTLFKVEFITKDTRLGASLVALEGIAIGRPEVTPIRGAKIVKGNKIKADGSGSAVDMVANWVAKSGRTEVTRKDLAHWFTQAGGQAQSVGHVVITLKKRGIIKGKGTGRNGYKVIGG